MTNNKKIEEKIQNVIGNPFDSTHIMSVFKKELNSLLQEIEEKVAREKWEEEEAKDAIESKFVTRKEVKGYDEGIDTALEVLKMIKERYK